MAVLVGASACESPRRRPWDQVDDGRPPPVLTPPASALLNAPSSTERGGDEPAAPAGSGAPSAAPSSSAEIELEAPVRVGGPWVRCYGNFRPSGDPLKDVTRLSLLCGPANGMRRLSPQAIVGSVVEGQPSVSEILEAKRGECYRVFAVAEPTVTDLDVEVKSSHDMTVAADHGEDSWPIVQPDRPFCLLSDDALRVEVSARHGQGRFAAEVWVLAAPNRAD